MHISNAHEGHAPRRLQECVLNKRIDSSVIGKKLLAMASKVVHRNLFNTYAWNYYTMKFMGIWPEERKWNQLSSYLVLIPALTMLCLVCAPQSTDLVLIWGDFDLIVENISMANITITISLLKTIAFWSKGSSLKSLLKCMAKDWSSVRDENERETMVEIAKVSRAIVIKSNIFCNSVVIIYGILRYITRQRSHNPLFFRSCFPYNVSVSPNYELTVFGQIVASFYAAVAYTAVDTFVAMLILHVCGQLSNLREEIRNLKSSGKMNVRVQLRSIVQKHDYLNKFSETIENCFQMMLLIQMLGCTVQLCFQCFQAVMSVTGSIDEFLVFQLAFLSIYIVYVMLQLYLYCYVGERLLIESTGIANVVYDCEWYNFPPKDARLLVIIMCRARIPMRITASKFCSFTLELYSQILKTSMGYVSVLYAMNNK